ncbi:putative spermidine/putrescine-binding periplasmic abc transporter protein [Oceanicola granulosus HTCC2516]|uniref:Putative spermidine/putrescine-binding periplasmic abc transporter protein n=1 Tax=Oceanicola granulosus (strain ATCC BAA-861 / DSM 15982 / KCTC 12143 / HTCC2516) TaxID=314256 RepID=Q2CC49_OCEGH|nr:extracellular solute-binding protein [Oceanicola granulosus]EAR50232.1 putative spermidine/putrescine-binding periplasmic abc transporter protein [Oceanicola granulosus HTCC2516]
MTTRRGFLASTGALALGSLAAPSILRAQGGALKVGTYGGYFEESFQNHIYPDFTAATGIEVESIAEPTGEAWLVQLQQAARAGQAPADVSMMAQVARIRGERAELWAKLDRAAMPNVENLPEHFLHTYEDGSFYGTGAVAWYISLVTNTDVYPEAPESWATLWDPANENSLGLLALASNSFLLEITATVHFGGTDILATEEGVLEVMNKLAEVQPNVRLWYRDEGQFQQGLETGEIPMGQYYHDVTGLAAADGKPVRSTFPAEGAVLDSGSWVVSRASDAIEQSQIFIDYMAQPEVQAKLSRFVGTAPTVPREMTDLTDEEFAAVSSDVAPILPRYELYVDKADWVNQKWSEIVTR